MRTLLAQTSGGRASSVMMGCVQPPPPRPAEPAASPPLTFDNPEAYLAEDRQRALATGDQVDGQVTGAALFADISGFTPLTEAFVSELGAQRGAEQVSDTLDQVFDRVLATLHDHGGSVVYFSGDAVTCWLDGDEGTLAVACGLAMQQAMSQVGLVTLPSGSSVQLGMKIAIAVGSARRFVVGDPRVQLIDVLAGALIDDLAAAEQQARQGEVVLDESAIQHLGGRVESAADRVGPGGRKYAVVSKLREPVTLPAPASAHAPLPEQIVRQWLLPAVYERMRTGQGEFLAELRPAVPLFLRFAGINYDSADGQLVLNDFIVRAQRIIDSYGGNALQLTIGDKGAYLYAVFGSPIAHEDDPARACAAALELAALDDEYAVSDIQIGIAHGRLRSGTYGHATRRTFCCLGDAVNLAARLMSAAPSGRIYAADAVQRAAGDRYGWQQLPEMTVKGKSAPVAVYELRGHQQRAAATTISTDRHTQPMIGRERELALVERRMVRAIEGSGQVVGISAEAGMGKSRLLAAAAQLLAARGIDRHLGAAQAFGAKTSYVAWSDVLTSMLGLLAEVPLADQHRHLDDAIGALDPSLVPRVPLLGGVLGLGLPDNELTRAFDAKLRKTSTEQLIAQILERFSRDRGPVAILIEDCNWLDPLSEDLLDVVVRAIVDLPIMLLLSYRPFGRGDDRGWHHRAVTTAHFTEIALDELDVDASREMIASRFAQVFNLPGEPPEPLVRLVLQRCEGNPFYVEELLNFVTAQGIDPHDAAALARLDVPSSLNSLVLSRIDVLAESPRRTVKVASVIGRDFRLPTLRGSYPQLGSEEDVSGHLFALEQDNLVLAEQDGEQNYGFRHMVIRDVAYESLPFAMRELLHGNVGSYIEEHEVDGVGGHQHLDLLAHHYWHSSNAGKKREYLVRAGDAAQASYANSVAIDYFRRAASLVPDADRGAILIKLGKVLELVGEWADAERTYAHALDLADELGDRSAHARARTALAEVARKQGQYDAAAGFLDDAEREFGAIGDEGGLGQVLHIGGTLAAQRGEYAEAREKYQASLEIRERLDDTSSVGSLLSNLAIVSEYEGDYAAARELNERALALRTQIGDRWAIGISQNNLGMIALLQDDLERARDCFAESMRLHREVGDLWMVAMGHNNLGNAMRRLGQFAEAGHHFGASLRSYRLFDERWALAILYEDIALYAIDIGDARSALLLEGAASAMREAIGSPRAPSQQQILDDALVPVRGALDDHGAAWTAEGGSLSDEDAVEAALAIVAPA